MEAYTKKYPIVISSGVVLDCEISQMSVFGYQLANLYDISSFQIPVEIITHPIITFNMTY